MADYIDREQVQKAMCDWCEDGICDQCAIKAVLSSIPSADVQPVVHGEWIIHRGNWVDEFECSICHKVSKTGGNFCFNCGARMVNDGKAN